jgi:hypothetical protein
MDLIARLSLSNQTITMAVDRLYVAGLFGRGFDLFAQVTHQAVNSVIISQTVLLSVIRIEQFQDPSSVKDFPAMIVQDLD